MAQPKQNSNENDKDKVTDEHDHSEENKEETHGDDDHNHNDHNHNHSHHGHSHGHSHGSGGCQHDHENVNEMSYGTSLYQFIDKKNCKCLNEAQKDSGKAVFKPYDERLDTQIFVESDIDGELLFTVYFTAEVQLRSIQLTS